MCSEYPECGAPGPGGGGWRCLLLDLDLCPPFPPPCPICPGGVLGKLRLLDLGISWPGVWYMCEGGVGGLGPPRGGLPLWWGIPGGGISIMWADGFLSRISSSHFLHAKRSRSSSLEHGRVLQGGIWGCLSIGGIPFRVNALSCNWSKWACRVSLIWVLVEASICKTT